MKAIYPNSLKKNKFISALAWKYSLQYAEFTPNQIQAPIRLIVDALEHEINESSQDTLETLVVSKCNFIFNQTSIVNEEQLSQSFKAILYYFKGIEKIIKHFAS
jgi:hypothetical protein